MVPFLLLSLIFSFFPNVFVLCCKYVCSDSANTVAVWCSTLTAAVATFLCFLKRFFFLFSTNNIFYDSMKWHQRHKFLDTLLSSHWHRHHCAYTHSNTSSTLYTVVASRKRFGDEVVKKFSCSHCVIFFIKPVPQTANRKLLMERATTFPKSGELWPLCWFLEVWTTDSPSNRVCGSDDWRLWLLSWDFSSFLLWSDHVLSVAKKLMESCSCQ